MASFGYLVSEAGDLTSEMSSALMPETAGKGGDSFSLLALNNELLSGVLQRTRPRTRWEAELVNERLAAVSRAHAWRHIRSLDIALSPDAASYDPRSDDGQPKMRVGPFEVAVAQAAAAARALVLRTRFTSLEVLVGGGGHTDCDQVHLKYAQLRAIAAMLAESPRVRLRSLLLRESASLLFGGSPEVVQLVRRHKATLESVALAFREYPEEELYSAVGECAEVLQVDLLLGKDYPHDAIVGTFGDKRLRSCAAKGDWGMAEMEPSLFIALPSPSVLQELHLTAVQIDLNCLLTTKPEAFGRLHQVRVSACDLGDAPLLVQLLRACPALRVLSVVDTARFADEAAVSHFVGAFFESSDDARVLFAELSVQTATAWPAACASWAAAWTASVPLLHVNCYDAAARSAAGLQEPDCARPPMPQWFDDECSVFVLQREGEKRRLVLALVELEDCDGSSSSDDDGAAPPHVDVFVGDTSTSESSDADDVFDNHVGAVV